MPDPQELDPEARDYAPRQRGRSLPLTDPTKWTGAPPPRDWIVDEWIPRGAVTALYGDGGVGKTLLAQQAASCVSAGTPLLGITTSGGRALLVHCEDDEEEMQRRQPSVNAALGIELRDLARLRFLPRAGDDNRLMAFSANGSGPAWTEFAHDLDATCRAWRPDLLIIDTATDVFGGSEIDRAQVRTFVQTCLGRFARDHRCGVLLLAHPSVAGMREGTGASGSTAWSNTVRSRLYLERPKGVRPSDPRRVLTRVKSNYAAAGEALHLELRDGGFRLLPVPPRSAERGARGEPTHEERAFAALCRLAREGAAATEDEWRLEFLATCTDDIKRESKERKFRDARHNLLKKERVVGRGVGFAIAP